MYFYKEKILGKLSKTLKEERIRYGLKKTKGSRMKVSLKRSISFFINFAEKHVTYNLVRAEEFDHNYPLVHQHNFDTDLVEHFDGEMFDPFTNELLSRPLNNIRWDYFLSNWEENYHNNPNYSPLNSN